MFQNYIKTALRFLWRQKAYSFINVLGLAIGLACSFFILLWVQDELRYDRFHEEGDRAYYVMRNAYFNDGQVYTWNSLPMPVEGVLKEQYPEIEETVLTTWQQNSVFAHGDELHREEGYYASPALFKVFSFPFLQGDPATALNDPYTVVISRSLAEKYFGRDWQASALGQTFRVDNRAEFTVTGVFEDVPENSSFQFDWIIPIEEFVARNEWLSHWGNSSLRLHVQLREGANGADVSAKIKNIIRENYEQFGNADLFLQPFNDGYLYSDYENGEVVGGRIEYVRIFSIVAFFILLIACINFMNLATARSAKRAREIGVRKTVGATQPALIGQFLGESVLLALVAFVVALGLVAAGLPVFNEITDKHIALLDLDPATLLLFSGIAVGAGLVAGSYPALYLSSFNVIRVLRSHVRQRSGSAVLRKALVTFQFALSILFIIGTVTVVQQIDYIRNKNLGLDRENLLYVNFEGNVREQYDAFRQELLQQPGIAGVTLSNGNPLSVGNSTSDPNWEGKNPDLNPLFHIINANFDFTETMKMELVAGRSFDRTFGTDSMNYVINEKAAQVMGMDDPIGQRLTFWQRTGTIVGVVKDFHMTSMRAEIEPTIIRLDPTNTWMLWVRTEPGRTEDALASLETTLRRFNPEYPFQYRFLDENYEQMYRSEIVVGTISNYFAVLAVLIACLGLFGLASFTAEQRTKEIGIRKVLGASVPGLVGLLSKDFLALVGIAFVLAAPLAYFVMNEWLSGFVYHIPLRAEIFIVAGATALLIAWLTVSYQAVRAALSNPVQALRTE